MARPDIAGDGTTGRRGFVDLAETLVLGALLERLEARHGEYEVLEHHRQGEFHHDVVLGTRTRMIGLRQRGATMPGSSKSTEGAAAG